MTAAPRGGLTAKSDGTVCVLNEDDMVVHGGVVAKKIWLLNLVSFKWKEQICGGEIPASRLFHSGCIYGGSLLMYGGEICGSSDADSEPYYELDMETYQWRRVPTHGTSPGHRSHHTAALCNGSMYVLGGKPTKNGRPVNQTIETLSQDDANGFFSIFVMEVTSRTWRPIERVDPIHPKVWGHTTVMFRHFMIVFGGFDVSQQGVNEPRGSPPSALLSDVVHTYNTESMSWSQSTPQPPSPIPRGLHVSLTCLAEMLVFGGMTVDPTEGSKLINDAWMWDIATGAWRSFPFCTPSWQSKRLMTVVHKGKLFVSAGVGAIHTMDIRDQTQGWTRIPCDPTGLCKSSSREPSLDISSITPCGVPASVALPKRAASPPLPYPQDPPKKQGDDVSALHKQLHDLQHQLSSLTGQASEASTTPHNQQVTALQEHLRNLQEQHKLQQTQQEQRKMDIIEEIQKRKAEHMTGFTQQQQTLEMQQEAVKADITRRQIQAKEGIEMESVRRQQAAYERMLQQHQIPNHQQQQQQQLMLQQQIQQLAEQQEALRQQYEQHQAATAAAVAAPPTPLPMEQVAVALAPQRAEIRPAVVSGESKLRKYRQSREKKKQTEDSESQHEARRLKHLTGLQERLREIENGIEVDLEQSPFPVSQASISPSPVPHVAAPSQLPIPQAVYQQQLYNANPQLAQQEQIDRNLKIQHDEHQRLRLMQQHIQQQQLQQQQQHQSLPAQLLPLSHRQLPPSLPTDPAEWNKLQDMLGDEYAQIDTGDFPIGRLLTPPGSPNTSPTRRK